MPAGVRLDNLVEIITAETNKYANQNSRNFETAKKEVLAFLYINSIMAVNRLPWIENYLSVEDSWVTKQSKM